MLHDQFGYHLGVDVVEIRTMPYIIYFLFFFFNDTATTEIYTLSLHDALPILPASGGMAATRIAGAPRISRRAKFRSEEHTSELQSHVNIVCRLLLEKKKKYRHLFSFLLKTCFPLFAAKLVASALAYSALFFFFNDTATTEIYTLSLHDALPI